MGGKDEMFQQVIQPVAGSLLALFPRRGDPDRNGAGPARRGAPSWQAPLAGLTVRWCWATLLKARTQQADATPRITGHRANATPAWRLACSAR